MQQTTNLTKTFQLKEPWNNQIKTKSRFQLNSEAISLNTVLYTSMYNFIMDFRLFLTSTDALNFELVFQKTFPNTKLVLSHNKSSGFSIILKEIFRSTTRGRHTIKCSFALLFQFAFDSWLEILAGCLYLSAHNKSLTTYEK